MAVKVLKNESRKIIKEQFDIQKFKREMQKIRFLISDSTTDLDAAIIGGVESSKSVEIVCLELQEISDLCEEIIEDLTNNYS